MENHSAHYFEGYSFGVWEIGSAIRFIIWRKVRNLGGFNTQLSVFLDESSVTLDLLITLPVPVAIIYDI